MEGTPNVTRGRLALAALVLCASACGGEAGAPARPNVVLVVVDTLRADHMSLYGYDRPTTPRLDALAEGAVVFERALAASSWTLPSMVSLFTGAYRADNAGQIDAAQTPLTEVLQGAGYRTGGVVSNALLGTTQRREEALDAAGRPAEFDPGFSRGFDHYVVYDPAVDSPGVPGEEANGWYGAEVVERGTTWLEAVTGVGDERPFFLFLHLFDPHYPRAPVDPGRFASRQSPARLQDFLERAGVGQVDEELRKAYRWSETELARYDAEVAHVDDAVGDLFEWLDARGLRDDTVVLLTADHGEGLWARRLGEGERAKPHNRIPSLYVGHGVQLYDEQVHVPLVLWAPGQAPGRVARTVSLVDVAPTLLRLADVPAPAADSVHGRDLLETADGPRDVFSFCTRAASLTEAGRWRLIVPADYRVEQYGATPELYDLASDPGERAPLDDPARLAAMSARLAAAHELYGQRVELSPEEEAERRARLDALGYIDQ